MGKGRSVDYIHHARCANGHAFRLRFGVRGPCVALGPEGKWTVRCPSCKTDGWVVGICHREDAGIYVGASVTVLPRPLQSARATVSGRRYNVGDKAGVRPVKKRSRGSRIHPDAFERIVGLRFGNSAVQELRSQSWHRPEGT